MYLRRGEDGGETCELYVGISTKLNLFPQAKYLSPPPLTKSVVVIDNSKVSESILIVWRGHTLLNQWVRHTTLIGYGLSGMAVFCICAGVNEDHARKRRFGGWHPS